MSIERLIESIGLSAAELKRYLLAEIDEFLEAESPEEKEEELGDVLFALMSMAWAHSGRHYPLRVEAFEPKVRQRLRRYGTLTRRPKKFLHDRIPELKFGVLHFAFGNFAGPWSEFDALRNGTVAEIQLLTEAPFGRDAEPTNHCIVTFDENDAIEYQIIGAAPDVGGGNTVLCRIPDFIFRCAKERLTFDELAGYLSLQVLAAIEGLALAPGAVAHFHSWESGVLAASEEFRSHIGSFETIFSPYLTVARLESFVKGVGSDGWTMTREEMAIASGYERALCARSKRIVVESSLDRDFYGQWDQAGRLEPRSFAGEGRVSFPSAPSDERRLHFVAGGRPVREKGFVEVCRQFASVREWAAARGIEVSLSILCRERRTEKGSQYIEEIERAVLECGLSDHVTIEQKTSLDALKRRVASSAALIMPSLYDSFGLMATYAVETRRPAFVSRHAGVSECIASPEFVFDPLIEGSLAAAIAAWYEKRPVFRFESPFPSYRDLYVTAEGERSWE
ncbi:MAG TPA: glycosyltransferase [Thermoanaerobaculia bacterium]|nr:glycosyltransferase [Thermoanaerobaculia bacterium]